MPELNDGFLYDPEDFLVNDGHKKQPKVLNTHHLPVNRTCPAVAGQNCSRHSCLGCQSVKLAQQVNAHLSNNNDSTRA